MTEHTTTEGLTEVDVAAHRDSYPMGNIHHGTPERPDWGTFCVECKQSWPCDVSRLADRLAAMQAERDEDVDGRILRLADRYKAERDAARREERMRAEDQAKAWRIIARVEALADEWEVDFPSPLASCSREVDEWWIDLRAALDADHKGDA